MKHARTSLVARCGAAALTAFQIFALGPAPALAQTGADRHTATPIKHVIIILGENRTFDHIFATYHLQANPQLWASTAVFVTFDEGGGYYDSGYIQPVDFFGDGPRIPLIVVSPYSTGGRVVHEYSDHVSTLKFVEENWGLPPITSRSRDNMPDPVASRWNPYVPTNSPAIDDLMSAFHFGKDHDHDGHARH